MISIVKGSTVSGITPLPVDVEVGMQKGLPKFEMVGLGQSAVKEGKERILTAIFASGFLIGSRRVIVNLAPASVKKEGSSLDLPIALGLLDGAGFLTQKSFLAGTVFVGELSLDGSVQSVKGAYAIVHDLRAVGFTKFVVPAKNAGECLEIDGIELFSAHTLSQVVDSIENRMPWPKIELDKPAQSCMAMDWSEVKGQWIAKRALEVAAAGGHHTLLAGTPGVGKTLLAKRFVTILPPLCSKHRSEVQRLQSLDSKGPTVDRPFRMPHHHASLAGMVGGGRSFRIGEFSLAHRGVLFMDEFPEFRRDVVEALREPLEEGVSRISRAEGAFTCPARFQLIAAMNLCPCGALGDDKKICACTPLAVQNYRNKLSRPVQDRLDIFVELKKSNWKILWDESASESSEWVRERVTQARRLQSKRYGREEALNSNVSAKEILQCSKLDEKSQDLLEAYAQKEGISLRAMEKVLRVSRTISDLDEKANIEYSHVCEALQYRFHLPY